MDDHRMGHVPPPPRHPSEMQLTGLRDIPAYQWRQDWLVHGYDWCLHSACAALGYLSKHLAPNTSQASSRFSREHLIKIAHHLEATQHGWLEPTATLGLIPAPLQKRGLNINAHEARIWRQKGVNACLERVAQFFQALADAKTISVLPVRSRPEFIRLIDELKWSFDLTIETITQPLTDAVFTWILLEAPIREDDVSLVWYRDEAKKAIARAALPGRMR